MDTHDRSNSSPTDWWPNWKPTPGRHTRNPATWAGRFIGHIQDGDRDNDLNPDNALTAQQFREEFAAVQFQAWGYKATTASGRDLLLRVHSIAVRAHTFYAAVDVPRVADAFRFDLAGLTEALSETSEPVEAHDTGTTPQSLDSAQIVSIRAGRTLGVLSHAHIYDGGVVRQTVLGFTPRHAARRAMRIIRQPVPTQIR